MDELIDSYISSSVWPDITLSKSSWNGAKQNFINNDTLNGTSSLRRIVGSIPAAGSFDSAIAHNSVAISSSIESNASEMSTFSQVVGDAHPINSFPAIWPQSYSDVSSFTGQSKLQGFGYNVVENSDNLLMKACLENGTHLNNFSSVTLHQKDQNGFQSFSDGQQISLVPGTLQPENVFQFSTSSERLNTTNQMNNSGTRAQAGPTNINGCNGVAKPRVRARRGQATDPHSIAERLRREKIAERMRNLQELVPSSNKIDKASMLDEIIDYVKFLQVQVKVLSMSRLGATGAVLRLLTNLQTEGSGSVLVSSSTAEGGSGIFESEESLAFEQEVVKLMETNVTSAMQYLQNRSVCLMPIALAAAISIQKDSSAAIPPEHRKLDVSHGVFSLGSHNCIDRGSDSGVNSCSGAVIKQEESRKPYDNGDLNQKAK